LSQQADELNHDLGHVYEPTAASPPPHVREAEDGQKVRDQLLRQRTQRIGM
jgi:hypothetical protein